MRRLFVLMCVLAGTGVGFYGTRIRHRERPARAAVTRPAPPPRATAPAAPPAERRPAPAQGKPALPSTTRELSPDDVKAVMRRLVGGRPQERDEAERFLVWHRAETEATVRAALETKLDPPMRAALDYVVASIAEEKGGGAGAPTVVSSPPRRGLVLVCDSLEAHEEIAMLRRTGKAARLDVTVVFAAPEDPARLAKSYAADLGDVRFLVDPGFAGKLKLERLPAVVGLRDNGRAAGVLYGRVRRSQLADLAATLVK